MEGVYVKTEPEPIPHASTSEPPVPLAVPLEAQPCRLCANIPDRAIEIYSTEGLSNQLSDRINEYLPVKVSPDDKLPLCCCWTCVTTLLSFHELVVACVEAEKRLQIIEPPKPILVPALPDPEPDIVEFNDDDAEMMDADDGEGDIDGDDDYEPENEDDDEESEEETKPIPGTSDDTELKTQSDVRDVREIVFVKSEDLLPDDPSRPIGRVIAANKEEEAVLREMQKVLIKQRCKMIHEDGTVYYRCDVCGKTTHYSGHLVYHYLSHTGDKRYSCDICTQKFQRNSNLKRHVETIHMQIKKFSCGICKKWFTTKAARDEHTNIHADRRPHVCEVCGKDFNSKSALRGHKVTHSDKYQYSCNACSKKFLTEENLIVHHRKHTEYRPFSCEQCGSNFKLKEDLRKHKQTHNKARKFGCDICGNEYRRKSYLRKHIEVKHGSVEEPAEAGTVDLAE